MKAPRIWFLALGLAVSLWTACTASRDPDTYWDLALLDPSECLQDSQTYCENACHGDFAVRMCLMEHVEHLSDGCVSFLYDFSPTIVELCYPEISDHCFEKPRMASSSDVLSCLRKLDWTPLSTQCQLALRDADTVQDYAQSVTGPLLHWDDDYYVSATNEDRDSPFADSEEANNNSSSDGDSPFVGDLPTVSKVMELVTGLFEKAEGWLQDALLADGAHHLRGRLVYSIRFELTSAQVHTEESF